MTTSFVEHALAWTFFWAIAIAWWAWRHRRFHRLQRRRGRE